MCKSEDNLGVTEQVGSVDSIVSRYTEKNFFKPVRYCMSNAFILSPTSSTNELQSFTILLCSSLCSLKAQSCLFGLEAKQIVSLYSLLAISSGVSMSESDIQRFPT